MIASLGRSSPFEIAPPGVAWARALHGFSWLRHLEAANDEAARDMARKLAVEWTMRFRGGTGPAWEAAVIGRRLISWISHAPLLLDGADAATYDSIAESLGLQIVRLAASWRDAPAGHPRLVALAALVLADLCVAGQDRHLDSAERAFAAELERQILHDGGHISRNPGVLVELMLDLLPLRQCFAARERQPPTALVSALARMLPHLRALRLGDGLLARFNGMGVASPAGLSTVVAYDDAASVGSALLPASRYARIEKGGFVLIADVGSPPPLEYAAEAHAGCLSFELSIGTRLVFVNGGAPGAADADWRAASRATASHNTLCLGETSSSRLIRHARLERLFGGPPIRGPGQVKAELTEKDGAVTLKARHDGYLGRYGVHHRRALFIGADGRALSGVDRIAAVGKPRYKKPLPFSVHFHLHPDAQARPHESDGSVLIALGPDGPRWRFVAEGAAVTLEESIYFADSAGPRTALQIELRGTTLGDSEVRWTLEPA
jgi:uncharacterized heparinase superfamily protein